MITEPRRIKIAHLLFEYKLDKSSGLLVQTADCRGRRSRGGGAETAPCTSQESEHREEGTRRVGLPVLCNSSRRSEALVVASGALWYLGRGVSAGDFPSRIWVRQVSRAGRATAAECAAGIGARHFAAGLIGARDEERESGPGEVDLVAAAASGEVRLGRAYPHPQSRFAFLYLLLTRSFQVSDSDDRSFERLARSVAFQNTLNRLHPRPSQPLSNTNGIINRCYGWTLGRADERETDRHGRACPQRQSF